MPRRLFADNPFKTNLLLVSYLPLIAADTLQSVSTTEETVITFPDAVLESYPELAGMQITVPAGSLYSNDGSPGGRVGIAPVQPDRLPGELPIIANNVVVVVYLSREKENSWSQIREKSTRT